MIAHRNILFVESDQPLCIFSEFIDEAAILGDAFGSELPYQPLGNRKILFYDVDPELARNSKMVFGYFRLMVTQLHPERTKDISEMSLRSAFYELSEVSGDSEYKPVDFLTK